MIVKVLSVWTTEEKGGFFPAKLEWRGITFITDIYCQEYDWLVVYDELPKFYQTEILRCPPSHTILVTQEPQSIKIYNPTYTDQFEYVLTTQDAAHLPHRNRRFARGCYVWFNGHPTAELLTAPEFEKTKLISAICSTKQMGHTAHAKRFRLLTYLEQHLAGLEWFGWGKKDLPKKHVALDAYKYTIPLENHIQPHHMSEKLPDALLSLCLPFYAGDPTVSDVFPAGSVIPIPLDDPEKAIGIIERAIADGAYEKNLPALREARRLILEKYNFWAQVEQTIREHEVRYKDKPEPQSKRRTICKRSLIRKHPINALRCLWYQVKLHLLGHL